MVSGKAPQWTYLVSADEQTAADQSRTLTVILENQEHSLRLTQNITAFAGHPFVRTWGTLENIGSTDLFIDDCRLLSILPCDKLPLTLFHVEQFSAKYRRDFFRPDEIRLVAGRTPMKSGSALFPHPSIRASDKLRMVRAAYRSAGRLL